MLFSVPAFAWGAFLNSSQKQQLNAFNINKEPLFSAVSSKQKVEPISDTDIPYAFSDKSTGRVGCIYKNETLRDAIPNIKMKLNYRVESTNPSIRKFALSIASTHPGAYNIGQVSAIFSYLKDGWSYVSDPRTENMSTDYYNYASESLDACKNASCIGAGDCDDFAILMSALIESIGGTTRYIIADNTSGKAHAYVEVYLGRLDNTHQIEDIIHWIMKQYGTNIIYAHIDIDTEDVWMNLDWSANHPGGSFYPGDRYYVFYIRDNLSRTFPEVIKQSNGFKSLSYAGILTDIGRALNNQSKFDKAIQCFNKAIKDDPNNAATWCYKGDSLYGLFKYGDAIKAYDEAIRIDPNLNIAQINRGYALKELDRDTESKKQRDKVSQSHPFSILEILQNMSKSYTTPRNQEPQINSADGWYNQGFVLLGQGRYEAAIQCFDRAITMNPNYAIAWNDRGVAYVELGNYNEALKCFNRALEIKPASAIWVNKGLALTKLNRYIEANAAFAKANELV